MKDSNSDDTKAGTTHRGNSKGGRESGQVCECEPGKDAPFDGGRTPFIHVCVPPAAVLSAGGLLNAEVC